MDEIYMKVKNHPLECWCLDCVRLDMDLVSEELKKNNPLS
jgi:hypothetical protein